jgi:GxxExxY protein
MNLIYREEVYVIIGACFEVYNEMGSGFLEDVYQEALEREFTILNVPYEPKPKLEIFYKGSLLRKKYEPDFVLHSKIILEIKTMKALNDDHRSQVHNYLKASRYQVGLLANFGKPQELEYERIVRTSSSAIDRLDS